MLELRDDVGVVGRLEGKEVLVVVDVNEDAERWKVLDAKSWMRFVLRGDRVVVRVVVSERCARFKVAP